MTTKEDGGPAFPLKDALTAHRNKQAYDSHGMSMRDWFAGQALPAIIGKTPFDQGDRMSQADIKASAAQGAYSYADALLAERSK